MALIPLPPPPPRHPWRRLAIASGIVLGLVALVLLFGEPLLEFQDQHRHPVPGRVVKFDDQPVHLFIKGTHGHLPTVVIDGDLGLPALAWAQLVEDLSRTTVVVAWDRPGYGWSGLGSRPHDGASLMDELHTALLSPEQLGPLYQGQALTPPFLLVGQGLGTLHMRAFANLHPQDVAGMVLLDNLYAGPGLDALKARRSSLISESRQRRFLIRRLFPQDPPDWLSQVPADYRDHLWAMLQKADMPRAESEEIAALDQTLSQADQLRSFGDKPLRILRTAIPGDEDLQRRMRLDNDLASLSTHGDLQVLPPGNGPGPMGQAAPLTQAIRLALGAQD